VDDFRDAGFRRQIAEPVLHRRRFRCRPFDEEPVERPLLGLWEYKSALQRAFHTEHGEPSDWDSSICKVGIGFCDRGDDESDELARRSAPMTAASITQKCDEATFRIAEHTYAPGMTFPGRTRAATWFVLTGSCRLTFREDVLVTAGQVVEMDAVDYTMKVAGDSELHLIQVWDLRPFMN
jgi:hypothetical protein